MSEQIAQLYYASVLNSDLIVVEKVDIEFDDQKVSVRVFDAEGHRLLRLKLKDGRLRSVYYYDDPADIVRKDSWSKEGVLTESKQIEKGDKKGSQLRYDERRQLWRLRQDEDRDSEYVSLTSDSADLRVLVGPAFGEHNDTTSIVAQFVRELADLDPKLESRERRVTLERVGTEVSVSIDKKRAKVFDQEDLE